MSLTTRVVPVFGMGLVLTLGSMATAGVTIGATIQGSVREIGGSLSTLGFFAAKEISASGLIDHGILEFDISSLSGTVPTTTLDMTIRDIDWATNNPGGEGLRLLRYQGDGLLTTSDFGVGNLVTTIVNSQAVQTISVDVTPLVQTAVDLGVNFLGFRFEAPDFTTQNGHRYDDDNAVPAVLTVGAPAVPSMQPMAHVLLPSLLIAVGLVATWKRAHGGEAT